MLLESKGTRYPKSLKAASLREDSDSVQMGQGMYVRNLLIDDAVLPSNEASLTESSEQKKAPMVSIQHECFLCPSQSYSL
ncbi:hypothetical protein AOT81_04255 [Xylella fastidiosa]|nr:hypothetical protein AOT81_04255 [Xylella fastidiosa]RWA43867.1 hypothetical protein XfCFBP8356_09415 [Xylella fastidiosa subsp. sandyi]